VAKVQFRVDPAAPHGAPLHFALSRVVALSASGARLPVAPSGLDRTVGTDPSPDTAVWPGDTNNDGTVNQTDVLPIGLFWQETGPNRSTVTFEWAAQPLPAFSWAPHPEAAYADADGDGVVDQTDLLAVGFKWGKTHTAAQAAPAAKTLQATLSLQPAEATSEGTWLDVRADDVQDLLGAAFVLRFPPDLLSIDQAEPGPWPGTDVLWQSHTDAANGTLGIGLSRRRGQEPLSGSGTLARVHLRLLDPGRAQGAALSLEDAAASFADGTTAALSTAGAFAVSNEPEVVPEAAGLRPGYPNPFSDRTTLAYVLETPGRVEVSVYDGTGRRVRRLTERVASAGRHEVVWDGRDEAGRALAPGTYFVRLVAGRRTETQAVLVVR
jgi:hypothetical protein